MNKLLVHLYVPAIMRDFDIFIPRDVPIGKLIPVLVEGIVQLSYGKYGASHRECLTPGGAGAPLQPDRALMDYGIQDGEMLLLI